MSYKVQFLDDDAFDKLPGNNMDTKVGVAYPEYGHAFVRKSGSNIVDTFTMAHELEHLTGNDLDEHYDHENKCYYKGFGEILTNLGTVIPGPWQAPAIAGSAVMARNNAKHQAGLQKDQMAQQQSQMYDPNQMMDQMQAQPNVIQAPGNAAGGQGGFAAPGTAAGGGPAAKAASQMGYYSGRDPFSGFGG